VLYLIQTFFSGDPDMSRRLITGFIFALSLLFAGVASHAAEPTMQEVYQAAQSGNFKSAQSMMDQVLRDHPNSGKAHFVQAEIYAKQGLVNKAKAELATAEQLAPGLPFEKPEAVQALKAYLASGGTSNQVKHVAANHTPAAPSFPWVWVLGGLALMGGLLYFAFGRNKPAPVPAMPMGGAGGAPTFGRGFGNNPLPPGGPAGAPAQTPPGYPPAAPAQAAGGMGSGIMGSIATGVAVGAGVVAGQALMNKVLGSGESHHDSGGSSGFIPPAHAAQPDSSWDSPAQVPFDMGGQNFGVNDTSSWDDDGSSFGNDDSGWN
jgi:hypothetical protein